MLDPEGGRDVGAIDDAHRREIEEDQQPDEAGQNAVDRETL